MADGLPCWFGLISKVFGGESVHLEIPPLSELADRASLKLNFVVVVASGRFRLSCSCGEPRTLGRACSEFLL